LKKKIIDIPRFNLIRQFKEHNLKQAQYSNSMLNKETLTREQKQ
jgi:hypothetical protein